MATKYNLRVIRILISFSKKEKRQLGYDPWFLWDFKTLFCTISIYILELINIYQT